MSPLNCHTMRCSSFYWQFHNFALYCHFSFHWSGYHCFFLSFRPAPMLGAAALSRLTTSVHTPPRPPCSWGPYLEAHCQAWPLRAPHLSTCVSRLTRFPTTCPCHLAGRWRRPAQARDTFSSKCTCNKCHCPCSTLIIFAFRQMCRNYWLPFQTAVWLTCCDFC